MARLGLTAARDAVTQFLRRLPADAILDVVQDDARCVMRATYVPITAESTDTEATPDEETDE